MRSRSRIRSNPIKHHRVPPQCMSSNLPMVSDPDFRVKKILSEKFQAFSSFRQTFKSPVVALKVFYSAKRRAQAAFSSCRSATCRPSETALQPPNKWAFSSLDKNKFASKRNSSRKIQMKMHCLIPIHDVTEHIWLKIKTSSFIQFDRYVIINIDLLI